MLTSCGSIRFVTVEHGRILTENKQSLQIIGNPVITCYNRQNELIATGYFVKQKEDSFIIDEYGKDYVEVKNSICKLGY